MSAIFVRVEKSRSDVCPARSYWLLFVVKGFNMLFTFSPDVLTNILDFTLGFVGVSNTGVVPFGPTI